MAPLPTSGPNGWIAQANDAVSEMEDFQSARDADRAAALVAYALLGAAINGFGPDGHTVVLGSAIAGLFPRCRCN